MERVNVMTSCYMLISRSQWLFIANRPPLRYAAARTPSCVGIFEYNGMLCVGKQPRYLVGLVVVVVGLVGCGGCGLGTFKPSTQSRPEGHAAERVLAWGAGPELCLLS